MKLRKLFENNGINLEFKVDSETDKSFRVVVYTGGEPIGEATVVQDDLYPNRMRVEDIVIADEWSRDECGNTYRVGLSTYKYILSYVQERGLDGLWTDIKYLNRNSTALWNKYGIKDGDIYTMDTLNF